MQMPGVTPGTVPLPYFSAFVSIEDLIQYHTSIPVVNVKAILSLLYTVTRSTRWPQQSGLNSVTVFGMASASEMKPLIRLFLSFCTRMAS